MRKASQREIPTNYIRCGHYWCWDITLQQKPSTAIAHRHVELRGPQRLVKASLLKNIFKVGTNIPAPVHLSKSIVIDPSG